MSQIVPGSETTDTDYAAADCITPSKVQIRSYRDDSVKDSPGVTGMPFTPRADGLLLSPSISEPLTPSKHGKDKRSSSLTVRQLARCVVKLGSYGIAPFLVFLIEKSRLAS